jgi:hypothetical protein
LPAWSRIAATRSTASTNRIATRMLYSIANGWRVSAEL